MCVWFIFADPSSGALELHRHDGENEVHDKFEFEDYESEGLGWVGAVVFACCCCWLVLRLVGWLVGWLGVFVTGCGACTYACKGGLEGQWGVA